MRTTNKRLLALEAEAMSILLHSVKNFNNLGMLWSMGKDSTVLLWMVRKLFNNKIPFPLFHIDTSFKIKEMIDFREQIKADWNLPLEVYQNKLALFNGISPSKSRSACCRQLKTEVLLQIINEYSLQGLLIGIRREEEGSRSKEKYFSLRNQDGSWNHLAQHIEINDLWPISIGSNEHYRIHPLLSWTEIDIWNYIKNENIPFLNLYLSKNGFRYRSLGCQPCTAPVKSEANNLDELIKDLELSEQTERSGRLQDTENKYGLEKLRQKGYM